MGVIVIDSIAALFRAEFGVEQAVQRAQILQECGAQLQRLSHSYSVAVICVNQVHVYTCTCTCMYMYNLYVHVHVGRICSSFAHFKERHYKLTHRLIHQGFWYSGLCKAFRNFARNHAGIFNKYKCSIHKHISEGICLPATDGRFITTRTKS